MNFSADLPVFFDAEGSRLDLAVVVYHSELQFQERPNGGYEAKAKLHLKLARKGEVSLDTEQMFVVDAGDFEQTRDPKRFALFELSRRVSPGAWAVTIDLDNLKSGEGLADKEGKATGILVVPSPPAAGSYLSDLEFRWNTVQGPQLPNPERLYGINQDTLLVYFELNRASKEAVPLAVRIEDPLSGFSQGDTIQVAGEGERRAATYSAPLETFLEGSYRLSIVPLEAEADSRQGDFVVAWNMNHLLGDSHLVDLEVELLFTGDQRERLKSLPRTARAAALDKFWAAHDPTPGTKANEAYDRFKSRVDYARRFFAEQGTPGPLTARGRVYIRYGPPAQKQFDVVPNDTEEIQEAVAKVHDPNQVDRAGKTIKSVVPLDRSRFETQQDLSRLTPGSLNSLAAFELWIYDQVGDPLLESEAPEWSEGTDLRFLFVDQLGTGVYHLETSNSPFRKD
ncbi:MAG TPA: GWxTD domain-containing protein [Candidatus Krumholzibacteria bacterium]|nr:GWxTD domain-containing protein [Candidatus Krumholzibacteria bacterium]